MPRVPNYDTFQVAPAAAPNVQLDAPRVVDNTSKQAEAMGTGMLNLGVSGLRLEQEAIQQANQVRVNDGLNQVIRASTDLRVQASMIRGRSALERPDGKSLPDEFTEKLNEQIRAIGEGLGNEDQRRTFQIRASQYSGQFYGALSNHMVEQQRAFQKETWESNIKVNQDRAVLLWGDTAVREESLRNIETTLGDIARSEGWAGDPKILEAKRQELYSPVHAGIISSMIKAGQAGEARKYYEANSAMMTTQARANVQGVIKQASDTQAAESAVDRVWGELGPKSANQPVLLFDMEKRLREEFKDNPDVMKIAIGGVRERNQAFNAQQNELNAGNVNAVFGLLDSGTSLRMVQRSDAWLALPEAKRREIRNSLESEAAAREARSDAAEQRNQRRLLLRNADAYLTYSDPTVLAGMTRAEVQALRPTFGLDATGTLLNRWDSLQKAEGKMEATIDNDTFNQVAEEMGLDPFNKKKSTEAKETLGALKYRIEKLIDIAQASKKAPLTRSEKEDLVRGEMSHTVTVNPGWLSFNTEVPVIALKPNQVNQVEIPAAERTRILEALKVKFKEQPDNPLFKPTEANVRRLFLINKSKAGAFIDAK